LEQWVLMLFLPKDQKKDILKNKMKKINLVECTLRDGGYYNNWDFDRILVQNYLNSLNSLGVIYVEMGFRSFQSKDFKGPNWYTTDSYIKSFKIPKKIKIGVMVNAYEIISHPSGLKEATNHLFTKKKNSRLDFVRLACHLSEFSKTLEIAKILQEKGYLVAVNLMQITERTEKEIFNAGIQAQKAKIDILYFADSLGSMNKKFVQKILKILKKKWKGAIGIHTHNNLGLALSNTITAIEEDVTWVDSTIMGMGRGAGNAQTEFLVLELDKFKNNFQNNLSLLRLIKTYFEPLQRKYKWGINSYYYLAGKFGIHPTYIQEMLNIKLNESEIIEAINQLKSFGASRYDVNLVRSEFQKPIKLKQGKWSPKGKIKGREVLLISSGPNLLEYKNEIENYIIKNKPFVIALNSSTCIKKNLINLYVACNPLTLLSDLKKIKNLKTQVVLPESILSDALKTKLKPLTILDYGVGIKENKFDIFDKCSNIPKLYTVAYALSVATSGQPSRILLAGFDGYGSGDRRTKIVDNIFYLYSSNKKAKKLLGITPSSYSFDTMSVYALNKN